MVDDRSMRFRQQAMPRVQPVQSTRRNAVADVNDLMRGTDTRSGYSRADQDLVNRRGGELFLSPMSTLLDEAKNVGAVRRGTPASVGLTGAAFVADLLNPSFGLPIGVGSGTKVIETAKDPTLQARANSLLGRLYHGVRNEPWSVAKNRPFEERVGNWFSADLFSTPDAKLASSYGPNSVVNLKNLPSNLKVLDLMPGGKTVAEQSPDLAKALGRLMGGNTPFDDVANPARHLSLTNLVDDQLARLMQQYGFNALRHISGQGAMGGSGRAKPVYAFFNPEGITANPVAPLRLVLDDIPEAVKEVSKKVGSRLVDSVDEALRQSNSSSPRVQQFLAERGNIAPGFTSSTGAPRRIFVDPDTGLTTSSAYDPYPTVSNFITALGRPAEAIRGAKQASLNAYQKALENYQASEVGRIQDFFKANVPGSVPSADMLRLNFPIPPGYSPAPAPKQPGALNFLQYLFKTAN